MSQSLTKKNRIFYLDLLRAFAIINIIGNHAINRAFHNYTFQELDFTTMTMPGTTVKAFITLFSRLGVFLFLMISGKLMLNKDYTREGALKRFFKHNYLSLFITTEIWFFIMFWELQFLSEEPLTLAGLPLAIGNLFQTLLFTNQTTMTTMWYMNMLLIVYLMLPIYSLAIQKLSPKVFLLPLGILFVAGFLVPNINDLLNVMESNRDVIFAMQPKYLFSMYTLYVFLGYFLDKGLLKEIPSWVFGVVFVVTCIAMTAFQVYGYSIPRDYIFDNTNVGFMVLAICIFELGRRHAEKFKGLEKPVTALSKVTFALYLVHLCIMHAMHFYMEDLGLNHWVYFIILYAGSILLSLLVIFLGSKVPFIRKYFFLIK